ncbi:MAG: deoxyribose-phosphate aldolase [Firmicutes bacterium]|jgi:deoxyribose-phosphate aldolase|nr:deoxyribose-phosphate aldolase [Bacillota bacterium]
MDLSSYIDHTLLKADASSEQIQTLCFEAKANNFKAVCINPVFVKEAAQLLEGSSVEICTVIGFPLGANLTKVKVFEAQAAVADGATEIDMVAPISKIKAGDFDYLQAEIAAVVAAVSPKTLKVILETCLLDDEQIVQACLAVQRAGADFVKTSTGFSTQGATLHQVQLMAQTIATKMKIKASGGIRTREQALEFIAAGAQRIGTSSGLQIVATSN